MLNFGEFRWLKVICFIVCLFFGEILFASNDLTSNKGPNFCPYYRSFYEFSLHHNIYQVNYLENRIEIESFDLMKIGFAHSALMRKGLRQIEWQLEQGRSVDEIRLCFRDKLKADLIEENPTGIDITILSEGLYQNLAQYANNYSLQELRDQFGEYVLNHQEIQKQFQFIPMTTLKGDFIRLAGVDAQIFDLILDEVLIFCHKHHFIPLDVIFFGSRVMTRQHLYSIDTKQNSNLPLVESHGLSKDKVRLGGMVNPSDLDMALIIWRDGKVVSHEVIDKKLSLELANRINQRQAIVPVGIKILSSPKGNSLDYYNLLHLYAMEKRGRMSNVIRQYTDIFHLRGSELLEDGDEFHSTYISKVDQIKSVSRGHNLLEEIKIQQLRRELLLREIRARGSKH